MVIAEGDRAVDGAGLDDVAVDLGGAADDVADAAPCRHGLGEPRAYALPWNRDLAEQLQTAQREAAEIPKGTQAVWQIPMTRTDIADYLGLTIETVSRVLSRLKSKGILRLPTLHSFEVVDEAALVDAAGAD